jgi:hypothetical protein
MMSRAVLGMRLLNDRRHAAGPLIENNLTAAVSAAHHDEHRQS